MTGKRTLPLVLKQLLFERMGAPEIVLVHAALCMVGTTEEGGNNRGALVQAFQMTVGDANGEAWCLSFVQALIAYVEDLQGTPCLLIATERVSDLWEASTIMHRAAPAPGRLALWRDPISHNGHIGIVAAVNPGSFFTIEGNTSPDSAGSQRDGQGVYIKKRFEGPLGSMRFLGFIQPF